jgi:hypothetical protein
MAESKANILQYLEQLQYHHRSRMTKPARSVLSSLGFLHLLVLVTLGVWTTACGGGEEESGPPVATPTFSMSRDRVAIGSPVTLSYKFQVASDAKFDADYWVFVHFLNPDGEQMWTDDHLPPTPTSRWQPGQTIEYKRTVFVPNYPYVGEASVRLGIYSQQTQRRLALSAPEASRREYLVGKFQLVSPSENVLLVDREGWHPAEVAPDNPSSEWKWTQKRAVLSFKNPKKDATFYIEYDARTDLFTPPQQVTISSAGQQIATFAADSRERKLLTFPISAAQFGPDEMSQLVLELDRTFNPAGGDPRELGIRVFHTFLEAK